MRRGIKYALVFTGGVAVGIGVCGVSLISYALNDGDIRDVIKNKVSRKIDKVLYGESETRRNRSQVSYVSYYNYRNNNRKRNLEQHYHSVKDIIFDTRQEAYDALDKINEILVNYGVVTVADVYDIADIPCCYADKKYGWTTTRNAEVVKSKDGYFINMSTPYPVD